MRYHLSNLITIALRYVKNIQIIKRVLYENCQRWLDTNVHTTNSISAKWIYGANLIQ